MSEHETSRRLLRKQRAPESSGQLAVPVVLPHLIARVSEDERVTLTLDGEPVTADPVDRSALGGMLDGILRSRRVPVRVEIIERDGTTYTDVLTPPPPAPEPVPDEASEVAPATDAAGRSRVPVLFEASSEGFIPGEDVALAVIIRHSSTNGDGHVRHVVEDRELAPGGEVLLFGRISGTTHVVGGLG
ncbi:MAG TPA: hypothetical protein DEA69_08375 [Microbacterium sp.]|uniref:hypothetical protein n=1 Tax=Microbacterium sp. UBA1097 TaxID=1946941 RepID=UPI000E93812A|nr:hypothetical protein [Microbacterium sp. UBA1097]HBS08801.1 hypothetical protein [Microbacterium sp.]|tara:strand:- start:35691 stop:36254 length:564 start_codon:yes stop_codon:yes gene_type:complete